jgi:hypothetical protein
VLNPEVIFSPAFTPYLQQDFTKVVRVFYSVMLAPDMVHCKFEAQCAIR